MTEYLTSGDATDWLSHNGMKNTLARSGVTTHVIRFIESEAYANGLEGSDMNVLAEENLRSFGRCLRLMKKTGMILILKNPLRLILHLESIYLRG